MAQSLSLRLILMTLVLGAWALSGCSEDKTTEPVPTAPPVPVGPNASLTHGVSFGKCDGPYCVTVSILRDSGGEFVNHGWTDEHPEERTPISVDDAQWARIWSVVDIDVLSAMDEVYGCPDCFDGGKEWILVDNDLGFSKLIEFEAHKAGPAELDELIAAFRDIYHSP